MRKALSLLALVAGCGLLAASALASVRQDPPANTFRVSWSGEISSVDPALANYGANSWALQYATGALLFNYPDAPAPRGSRLIPEVAAGYPRVSKDGRTYTFKLKKTYRFADGRGVTAENFVAMFNRNASKRTSSASQPFFRDVVGMEAVTKGLASEVSGVKALNDYSLQIRLTQKAPDILARLAMPFFQPTPLINLRHKVDGIYAPYSAGPYFVRRWTNRRIVLERNRHYRGPRPHRVARIDIDIGRPFQAIKDAIDRGATDTGDIPFSAHAELGRTYGVRRRSPGRYFANPSPTIHYLAMNHDRPLFGGPTPLGNVPLKKAVNYAIDRVALMNRLGPSGGVANDQLLPPTMRGSRNAAIYPRRPDLNRARILAAGHTRSGSGILSCSHRWPAPEICQYVRAQLREIGLDMQIKLDPRAAVVFRPDPYDLRLASWHPDYFDPYEFTRLVDGRIISPAGTYAFLIVNWARFNDPGFNRKIRRAQSLSGVERYRAFSKLDHDFTRNAAPIAVLGNANERQYVSERTGCYHHHPVYGFDFPAICLRS